MYAHADRVLYVSDGPLRELIVWIEELGMHASLGGAPAEVVATITALRDKLRGVVMLDAGTQPAILQPLDRPARRQPPGAPAYDERSVVWSGRLDKRHWITVCNSWNESHGVLVLKDGDAILMEESVRLGRASEFGPHVEDVAAWKKRGAELVAELSKKS